MFSRFSPSDFGPLTNLHVGPWVLLLIPALAVVLLLTLHALVEAQTRPPNRDKGRWDKDGARDGAASEAGVRPPPI